MVQWFSKLHFAVRSLGQHPTSSLFNNFFFYYNYVSQLLFSILAQFVWPDKLIFYSGESIVYLTQIKLMLLIKENPVSLSN